MHPSLGWGWGGSPPKLVDLGVGGCADSSSKGVDCRHHVCQVGDHRVDDEKRL